MTVKKTEMNMENRVVVQATADTPKRLSSRLINISPCFFRCSNEVLCMSLSQDRAMNYSFLVGS